MARKTAADVDPRVLPARFTFYTKRARTPSLFNKRTQWRHQPHPCQIRVGLRHREQLLRVVAHRLPSGKSKRCCSVNAMLWLGTHRRPSPLARPCFVFQVENRANVHNGTLLYLIDCVQQHFEQHIQISNVLIQIFV